MKTPWKMSWRLWQGKRSKHKLSPVCPMRLDSQLVNFLMRLRKVQKRNRGGGGWNGRLERKGVPSQLRHDMA
jgi:hypothetical protein